MTSFHPSSGRLLFLGLVTRLLLLSVLDDANVTTIRCAAAVAIVAETSLLIDKLLVGADTEARAFALEMIDVASALVISATVVALRVSRGLEENKI